MKTMYSALLRLTTVAVVSKVAATLGKAGSMAVLEIGDMKPHKDCTASMSVFR